MKYVGLQSQISRNNFKSILLLIAFPLLLLGLVWFFFFILNYHTTTEETGLGYSVINESFMQTAPFVVLVVGIWFVVAWYSHSSIISSVTGSKPLERKKNKRVYNLTENLCISRGLTMPKVYIIEDDSLNAYASGINDKTFAITLSRGMIDKLDDNELEAVIAHELTHIINRDVRLLIVSIIFVGIFSFITEIAIRSVMTTRGTRNKDGKGIIVVILLVAVIGLALSTVFRFALSRKREYLADAGAAELTKNPLALASALRKVSADPWIEAVESEDVAQLFIEHPTKKKKSFLASIFGNIFATHPPIEKRIQILEQF